jgi:hypothetical protein
MYPTDLTQTQWQFIKKALDFDDRKRKYDFNYHLECYYLFGKNRLPVENAAL